MRWLSCCILAYVMIGLQIGLAGYAQWRGGYINWPLLAVVFFALNAPRDQALLGAFLLGIVQDLVTLQPVGLNALAYGMAALLITGVAQLVDQNHPLSHLILTLVGGGILGMVLIVQDHFHRTAAPTLHLPVSQVFLTAVMTAVAAPFVLGILQRVIGAMGAEREGKRGYR